MAESAATNTPTQLPCPICGHQDFEWGDLTAQGLQFHADSAGWWEHLFSLGYRVRGRVCRTCSNIQLFAQPERAPGDPQSGG